MSNGLVDGCPCGEDTVLGCANRPGGHCGGAKVDSREEAAGRIVTGYMCRIDWECELGVAADGTSVYPSIKALRKDHACADSCGIVEVAVNLRRVVVEGEH